MSPSEYKPLKKNKPLKRSFEKYKPQGLFSEFHSILTTWANSASFLVLLVSFISGSMTLIFRHEPFQFVWPIS